MRHFALLTGLILVSCTRAVPEAAPIPQTAALHEPLPLDSGVRTGVLDNGLTWFIEVNREPAERAVLRLAVDAGSILEDEDQLGLAHVLEHMAFNGTENFPGNTLITYLESTGTRFGAHLNAHTGFDETVYKLQVPTDDLEQLDTGLLVLRDWAGGLTFDPEEIDKERGVVLEEWRLRLGPGERLGRQIRPLLFQGSPYHERMPIGTEESLRTFTPEAIERFYRDWYRPDLMAVIVVGDVDPDEIEASIVAKFSDLQGPDQPRERVRPEVPGLQEPAWLVLTDPEVPTSNLQVSRVFVEREGSTHGDYRRSLAEGLMQRAMAERLGELSRREDSPLLGAFAGRSRITPTSRADQLGINPKAGREIEAYELVLTELRRFVEFGPTEGELDRARRDTLRFFRSMLKEIDQTSSTTHAEEIIRVFMTGEPMPGLPYEVALAERFVPDFTVQDIQVIAEEFLQGPRLVVGIFPEGHESIPSIEQFQASEARVATVELAPPEAEGELVDPIEPPPTPGSVVHIDRTFEESLGFVRYDLSNGVQVYVRPTDFKSDEVRFAGFRPGGSSLIDDADYVPLATMGSILTQSGVGALDAEALRRWLAGKNLSVTTRVGTYAEKVSGSASPEDLGYALQLLHAKVVAPRFDETAFALDRASRTESLRNRLVNPAAHFSDAWTRLVSPDDPRAQPWTVERLAEMDLARSEALYRERFGDLAGLQLVFVGAIPDDFEDLLSRWVATLPASGEVSEPRDRGFRPVQGEHELVVERGSEPQARVRMFWHGPFDDPSLERRAAFEALMSALRVQLRESLREELGGVYGVSAYGSISDRFDHTFDLSVTFSCDPDRVDELVAEVERIFAQAVETPPEERLLTQYKETVRRSYQEMSRTNDYWMVLLRFLEADRDPVPAMVGAVELANAVSAQDVQSMAAQTLSTPNLVRGRLIPASPPSTEEPAP
ncbi:MAG: insulinase family protein [Deltaproteobacteria bacterium]|nr:MAG: insulinase family protein [Deltaproteobacteria bacterium]